MKKKQKKNQKPPSQRRATGDQDQTLQLALLKMGQVPFSREVKRRLAAIPQHLWIPILTAEQSRHPRQNVTFHDVFDGTFWGDPPQYKSEEDLLKKMRGLLDTTPALIFSPATQATEAHWSVTTDDTTIKVYYVDRKQSLIVTTAISEGKAVQFAITNIR